MAVKPKRPPLTPRQKEALAAIKAYIKKHGWPPTLREIGEALGIGSPNGVMCHLSALEAKGYITRSELVSRGIRVL